MTHHARRNRALLALTSSALALPGLARAQAPAAAPDEYRVDYRYSNYQEDDIPDSKKSAGDSERYEIDSHQFKLVTPTFNDFSFAADLTYESMSGASPWFILPIGGQPMQVMSGATIEEDRTDLLLATTRRFGGDGQQGSGTISLGYSDENDYQALNFGAQVEWQLPDTVSTLSGGLGYSDDEINPTDAGAMFPKRVQHAERDATTGFIGYAYVLDADTVIQTSLSYTKHEGFLSDPYKEAFIVSLADTVADSRPNGREQVAWLTRLRHYFPGVDGALHADYRLYDDDWDVTAHTVDLGWYQNFAQGWQVVPGLRYYSQSQAFFYEPFYTAPRSDGFASSDYRLSPYGAISLSLAANKEINGWGLSLRYENYNSDADYALKDVDVENPGLVDFGILSFSVKKTF